MAILTILGIELDAMLAAFGIKKSQAEERSKHLYWRTRLGGGRAEPALKVVIGVCNEAGTVSAALRTVRFLDDFSPSLLVLAGIAAGDKQKYKQGDVVRGYAVADVSMAQVEAGTLSLRPGVLPYPSPAAQLTRSYSCDHRQLNRTTKRILKRLGQPLIAPNDPEELKIFLATVATEPTVHDCVIGSGNLLVRDADKFGEYQKLHPKITAIEMEAAGMVAALRDHNSDLAWLVIRGISDFGDVDKDKIFNSQPYAAAAAAAYTRLFTEKSLLRVLLVRPSELTVSTAHVATSAVAAPPTTGDLTTISATGVDIATDSPSRVDAKITEIRTTWRKTPTVATFEELQRLYDSEKWGKASPASRAAALRLEAEMVLVLRGDHTKATALATEAEHLDGPDRVMRARIASYAQGPRVAAEIISEPRTTAEWNMKMGLFLDADAVEEMFAQFATPPEGVGPNTETRRIHALALVRRKKVGEATSEITLARVSEPESFAVRYAAAVVDYFAAISIAAPGEAFTLHPLPIPFDFVKRDSSALDSLDRAAAEFKLLAEISASLPKRAQLLESWHFAALANNALRQSEAKARCLELLQLRPTDALILQWANERDYLADAESSINALAEKFGIQL